MRVAVFGAGAMGSLFAARLAVAGEEITLVGRPSPHLDAIQHNGLQLVERDGVRQFVPLTVALDPSGVTHADLILLMVKAWATAGAVASFRPYLAPSSLILTLQNGLGNRESIRGALGERLVPSILVGVTSQAALRPDAGMICHTGRGPTRIGGEAAVDPDTVRAVARLLSHAGIPTVAVADIDRWLWHKLSINVAINGLTALIGEENGALVENPALRIAGHIVSGEVARVARSQGFDLGDVAAAVDEVALATAGNRSSMLADLENGKETEIEAIHGAALDVGQSVGVEMPATRVIYALLRHRAGHARRTRPDETENRNFTE